jgi:hypothetical protein
MVPAPIDSAAVAGALAGTAASWLSTTFPGMDAETLAKVASVLGSLPVIALIFLWEMVGKGLGKFLPGVEAALGPFWAKYKIFLNPILGLIFGTAGGNPVLGLIASGVWSVGGGAVKVIAGPSTAAGRARAGMGVILALFLLLPATSSAAEKIVAGPFAGKTVLTNAFPLTFQGGLGAQFLLQSALSGQRTVPYLWGHVTYPIRDRWILRARLEQPLQREPLTRKLGKMVTRVEAGFSFP